VSAPLRRLVRVTDTSAVKRIQRKRDILEPALEEIAGNLELGTPRRLRPAAVPVVHPVVHFCPGAFALEASRLEV
jgi:hypothetical protein